MLFWWVILVYTPKRIIWNFNNWTCCLVWRDSYDWIKAHFLLLRVVVISHGLHWVIAWQNTAFNFSNAFISMLSHNHFWWRRYVWKRKITNWWPSVSEWFPCVFNYAYYVRSTSHFVYRMPLYLMTSHCSIRTTMPLSRQNLRKLMVTHGQTTNARWTARTVMPLVQRELSLRQRTNFSTAAHRHQSFLLVKTLINAWLSQQVYTTSVTLNFNINRSWFTLRISPVVNFSEESKFRSGEKGIFFHTVPM